jgi:hypothetical protein
MLVFLPLVEVNLHTINILVQMEAKALALQMMCVFLLPPSQARPATLLVAQMQIVKHNQAEFVAPHSTNAFIPVQEANP